MQVLKSPFFIKGFRQMLPITTGAIPFGAVMGAVFFNAKVSWGTKFLCAYTLTDQSYAVMLAHHEEFKKKSDAIDFYLGTAVCMFLAWHTSVIAGYIFGNFAPASWNLDFAVPLSFLALLIPTLKNKTYWLVALFSTVVSILCYSMPLKTGLITTAALSIAVAVFLTQKPVST